MRMSWPRLQTPSYSNLKQEDSSSSESDTASRDDYVSGQKIRSRKHLVISLIVNATLMLLIAIVSIANWQGTKPKKLLSSPVPDCEYFPRIIYVEPSD